MELLAVIGATEPPPSEAMLGELEAELDALRREGFYGTATKDVVDTVRFRRLIAEWKARHFLEARPDQSAPG